MLIALLHMQVDVCYLRQGRRRQYKGMPAFRKNIIAFPQELAETKHLLKYWTCVDVGHRVEIVSSDAAAAFSQEGGRIAKVHALQPDGLDVVYDDDGVHERVPFVRVRARVRLPWKPDDLRDVFIVLRRRNANK